MNFQSTKLMSFFSMKYFKIRSLLILYMHRFKRIYSGLSFSLLKVTLSVLVQPTEAFMNFISVIWCGAISTSLSANMINTYSPPSSSVTRKVAKGQGASAWHQDIRPAWSQLISHYLSVAVTQWHPPNSTAHTSPLDSMNIIWVCQMTCWNPDIHCLCHFPKAKNEIRSIWYNSFLFKPGWSL